MTSPTGATRLYPIIGDPIKYVESPTRLTRTLHERGHDAICIPMQVPGNDLAAMMAGLTAISNVDGILVTMPHKFTAFTYCDQLDTGQDAQRRQHHPPQRRWHLAR